MPDRYVLDANCFIEPHQRFYPFDIAPGYWKALKEQHESGRICSIDRVKTELLAHKDRLSQWVSDLDPEFFKQTRDHAVIRDYRKIMTWVESSTKYTPAAKAEFARGADGWLIAFSKVNNRIVVSSETYESARKNKVKIPNSTAQ